MRKMESSANADLRIPLSFRAEARSRPNGFSTITRALSAHPARSNPVTTVPNNAGGIAR